MKNKEKYYEEILEAFVNGSVADCELKKRYILNESCCGVACSKCREKTAQWLEEEYKEQIKLTRNEKAILESISKEYEWIARDFSDNLYCYKTKPYKMTDAWYTSKPAFNFSAFNHLFQFIKWEDEEPILIEDLLKCEVKEDD